VFFASTAPVGAQNADLSPFEEGDREVVEELPTVDVLPDFGERAGDLTRRNLWVGHKRGSTAKIADRNRSLIACTERGQKRGFEDGIRSPLFLCLCWRHPARGFLREMIAAMRQDRLFCADTPLFEK